MKLLKNYILLERIKEEEKVNSLGLVVVDNHRITNPTYTVKEIGEEVKSVKVGDSVLLADSYSTVKYGDLEIIKEDSVVAVL